MEEEEDWFLKNAVRVDDKVRSLECRRVPHIQNGFFTVNTFYQSENLNCFSSDLFFTLNRTSIRPALKTIKM